MKKNIYVTQPFLPPLGEFMPFIGRIWESRQLTNGGQFHQELEEKLCEYLKVKYISLFSNGTIALITALQAMEVKGEVITTPYSFPATTHALYWKGIKPVFADLEHGTFNISPELVEKAITADTTAIMPVHVYGYPCRHEELQAIAKKHQLKLIYDAAHTFGARQNNVSVCSYGDLSVLSFHATKVFTTFEGGAIISHTAEMKKRIDLLKNFGIADETTVIEAGINGKLNELQAAYGLLQLKYVDKAIEKQKEIAGFYKTALSVVQGITIPAEPENFKNNYSYFPILVDRSICGYGRNELYEELRKNNIFSRKYFYPLISNLNIYSSLVSASKSNLKIANDISEKILCLPIYPDLKHEEAGMIAQIIINFKG